MTVARQAPGPTRRAGSALYVGSVRHRRHRPRQHAFRYRTYHVMLDLDELARLDREIPGFGYNRRSFTGFHDVDHLGAGTAPVRHKLARWLEGQGAALPDGPVRVLTNLRVLGHVFNPVSWWFCHDTDGTLALVVAEVNNTFGESYCYLLDRLEHRDDGSIRAAAGKRFHVSPFLPVNGLDYRFTFVLDDATLTAHMDVHDAEGRLLDATQRGRRLPFTSRTLARTLCTHPLMTLRTVVLIHVEALRLVVRRVPFFHKPPAPDNGYGAVGPCCDDRDDTPAPPRGGSPAAQHSILATVDTEPSRATEETNP